MKKIIFIFFILFSAYNATARHIAGGELYYEYIGANGNNNTYRITLRLFRECTSDGPLLENEMVNVGIYDQSNNSLVQSVRLPLQGGVTTLSLHTASFPCLVGTVNVCYQMAYYSATVDIPVNANGYLLSRSGANRTSGVINISNSVNTGATYSTQIPGTNLIQTQHNSSPQFLLKDTTLICASKNFALNFGAEDGDSDSLTYALCDGYNGVRTDNGALGNPYTTTLSYVFPYTGAEPLGSHVTIDSKTGIISGIAPPSGLYVVNVCITEWRKGVPINLHRKDFLVRVQNCDIADAQLPDKIMLCKDDFTVYFENQSLSTSITSYLWTVGDPKNPGVTFTTPTVTYTYLDTGTFKATLFITGPRGCTGLDSTTVIVYPGFKPKFFVSGSCYQTPFQFTDSTYTKYGKVNSWNWNFGDPNSTDNTSAIQNPTHKYATAITTMATLIVGTNKGCIDTLQNKIIVLDKPPIALPFRDTLICSIDTLPLIASVNGAATYTWSPNYNIINSNTSNPLVYPKDTTIYYVDVNFNGCINRDSIKVNVLDFITIDIGPDTSVCLTDTFRLKPVSHALSYNWTPTTGLSNPNVKYPVAQPPATMRYYVTANLGKCQARDSILITTYPYPQVTVSPDTSICFGTKALLRGKIVASIFSWSPNNFLLNPNTLNPIAAPPKTTNYILTVSNIAGCLKPVSDTITVTVITAITVFAGHDTSIVVNQPLQLNATSNFDNMNYVWTPSLGLTNPNISDPIATLGSSIDSIKYRVRATTIEGCFGEDDIVVRVFKTGPDIFVPSAFSPNSDGLNDILKPLPVGISTLTYFRIYNRWGQLLYSTSEIGKGWNGTANGTKQPSGAYVYMAEGVDYTGKVVFRKGTSVLIR
jgi:gliding motility-associated-like protein